MPTYADLYWAGSDFTPSQFADVTSLDADKWSRELNSSAEFFKKFGEKAPREFTLVQTTILDRFQADRSRPPVDTL